MRIGLRRGAVGTAAGGVGLRRRVRRLAWLWLAGMAVAPGVAAAGDAGISSPVTVLTTPEHGIQPQAVCDALGAIHVVFFRGEPASGDIFYARLEPGAREFTAPIRVNSQAGSAVALGTMRGAQVAVGRGGRVHVAWNGSMRARPQNPLGGTPMLYARSDAARAAFEPERDLMRRSSVLDGGGTVAADPATGRVFVAWHARPEGAQEGEANRRLFVARSEDDGATFAPESPAVEEPTGACPCCGTRALATASGGLSILFRSATGGSKRDMTWVSSPDGTSPFRARRVHPWSVAMCPMSSESLAEGPRGLLAAWETQNQVYFAWLDPRTGQASAPTHPRGLGGNRKHPAVACNARGDILIAWAEDTSFTRGGSLAWQLVPADGSSKGQTGRIDGGIPTHSLPTAVARPDGTFVVIH